MDERFGVHMVLSLCSPHKTVLKTVGGTRGTGVSISHPRDLCWLISIASLTRLGSGGTRLGVSVKAFPEMVTRGDKSVALSHEPG